MVVARRPYRFRLLNAASARTWNLRFRSVSTDAECIDEIPLIYQSACSGCVLLLVFEFD